jgi:hypothetical protein
MRCKYSGTKVNISTALQGYCFFKEAIVELIMDKLNDWPIFTLEG